MTLDKAIQHARQQEWMLKETQQMDCAEEHRQLAEWLTQLRAYRRVHKRIIEWLQQCEEESGTINLISEGIYREILREMLMEGLDTVITENKTITGENNDN